MTKESVITGLVTAMRNKFELKVNKKTSFDGISANDDDSYATINAIKSYISGAISNFVTQTELENAGYLTQHQDISGKVDIAQGNGKANLNVVTDSNGNVTTEAKVDISGKEDSSNKVTSMSGNSTNTQYPSAKAVYDALITKANSSDIPDSTSDLTNDSGFITISSVPTKVSDLQNDSGFLTQHQSLDGKTVTLEEQETAETGYLKTYVIKQGGTALNTKINIPKDFLVKSATVETVSTANDPVNGYAVGDKYLDFIINTPDNSDTDDHVYVNVNDLIDIYTAGNGLTLLNNQFSISNGAITKAMLAQAVQTSLDEFGNSPAHGITSTMISNWNNSGSSNLTIADVDSEIEDYITALTTALE